MELVSIKDALKRLSISRTKLWELSKTAEFPRLVVVTGSRKAFVAAELDEWIANRIANNREPIAAVVPDTADPEKLRARRAAYAERKAAEKAAMEASGNGSAAA